jgi:hypothetical protein
MEKVELVKPNTPKYSAVALLGMKVPEMTSVSSPAWFSRYVNPTQFSVPPTNMQNGLGLLKDATRSGSPTRVVMVTEMSLVRDVRG